MSKNRENYYVVAYVTRTVSRFSKEQTEEEIRRCMAQWGYEVRTLTVTKQPKG